MKNPKMLVILLLTSILALGLWGCSSAAQPTPERVVVTVVNTVPVEVTRLVQVPQTVEVTRQVVVTQLVEVPVTPTPAPTETPASTPTPVPPLQDTSAPQVLAYPNLTPSPTFPQEKVEGFSLLKIVNETNDSLVLSINGPFQQSYDLPGPKTRFETVKEGKYDYTVTREGKVIFRGTMNITNPDKHELHIRADKVVFLVP